MVAQNGQIGGGCQHACTQWMVSSAAVKTRGHIGLKEMKPMQKGISKWNQLYWQMLWTSYEIMINFSEKSLSRPGNDLENVIFPQFVSIRSTYISKPVWLPSAGRRMQVWNSSSPVRPKTAKFQTWWLRWWMSCFMGKKKKNEYINQIMIKGTFLWNMFYLYCNLMRLNF